MDPHGRIYETAWGVLSTIVDMGFALYYQLFGNTEAAGLQKNTKNILGKQINMESEMLFQMR